MKPSWTPERVEQLKALRRDNFSASEIAAQLGGVSRNAVISKLSRLGLTQQRAPRVGTQRFVPRIKAAKLPRITECSNDLVFEEPTRRPVALMNLERHHCRWPVGTGSCGANKIDGKSYCAHHLRKATR